MDALSRRALSADTLARLLECTERHAEDLLSGHVPPKASERCVMRLCATVPPERLGRIIADLARDYEWKRIPGFERYEASKDGLIRRAAHGHGSLPGHVLKPKRTTFGYLYVKLAPFGQKVKQIAVHTAVCLAFHGPRPSQEHVVCHRNDVADDNRAENLYWGTQWENAQDRIRNTAAKNTPQAQSSDWHGPPTLAQRRKSFKISMACRLEKINENS